MRLSINNISKTHIINQMFSLFKLTLKYGKKAVLLAEIALESLHIGHKKHQKHVHVAKNLTYTTSENVFNKIRSQVVHLFKEDQFIGIGIVFNDTLIVHNTLELDSESHIHMKYIISDSDTKQTTVELLHNKYLDGFSLYKLESSMNNFKDTYNPIPLEKGEQILVYSPLEQGVYTLHDAYVVKTNVMDDMSRYLYHRTSIINNDSEFSDAVYDYQGNFQGIIPPKSDQIIHSHYLFGILKQLSTGKELRHMTLPVELGDVNEENGDDNSLVITRFHKNNKEFDKYIDYTITEVDGIPIKNQDELYKAISYNIGREIEFKVQNKKGVANFIRLKVN